MLNTTLSPTILIKLFQLYFKALPSNIFLKILVDLVNTGRATILDDTISPASSKNMVGFKEEDKVYIMPSMAHREVQKVLRDSGNQLNFSINEIGRQLIGDGKILEHEDNRPTKLKRWKGKPYRVFVLPLKIFEDKEMSSQCNQHDKGQDFDFKEVFKE